MTRMIRYRPTIVEWVVLVAARGMLAAALFLPAVQTDCRRQNHRPSLPVSSK